MITTSTGFLQINTHLTNSDIAALVRIQEGWCLSLYLPLHHDGRVGSQSHFQLRELETRARKELTGLSLPSHEIEAILSPVERILETPDFTHLPGDGLAILSSNTGCACYLLPEAPRTLIEVDRRFRLDSLIPILLDEEAFFLLALDLGGVSLYEGDRNSIRTLALDGSPFQAPRIPAFDRHSAADYCREIDCALKARIAGKERPLILAGSQPLLVAYQEWNTYPHLLDEAIVDGPGAERPVRGMSDHELQSLALSRLRASRARQRGNMLRVYRDNLATERTAVGMVEVLLCAQLGMVEHLFVRKGYVEWGAFDPASRKVATTPVPTAQSENLVNMAILGTVVHEGRIHVVPGEEMPPDAQIAALCRF